MDKNNIDVGLAAAIFKDIYRTDIDVIEKKKAIKIIADMDTHNGIKKAEMLNVIRWMSGLSRRTEE